LKNCSAFHVDSVGEIYVCKNLSTDLVYFKFNTVGNKDIDSGH